MDSFQKTIQKIKEILPYVNLTVDSARRQFLIAPLILDLVTHTKAETNFDYSIPPIGESKVVIHYFLESCQTVIIMSAENQDLACGITELHSCLFALDKWLDFNSQNKIFGSTTTGYIWQFSCLNRQTKEIYQDPKEYQLFENIQDIMNTLTQALKGEDKG
jgi:hypothetical protein